MARTVVTLCVVLGLAGWGTAYFVERRCAEWFERDARRQAEGHLEAVRPALLESWRAGEVSSLAAALDALGAQQPVRGVALFDRAERCVAASRDFPATLRPGVTELAAGGGFEPAVARAGASPEATLRWAPRAGGQPAAERVGRVGLVGPGGEPAGTLVLVADLSDARARAARLGSVLLALFAALALIVPAVVGLVQWRWRRAWTEGVRAAMRGDEAPPEATELVAEIRERSGRAADLPEPEGGPPIEAWTPSRLRRTLRQHLQRERVLIVANREPYIHDRTPDGDIRVRHPASGLVSALEPVMRACSGVWVAHGSGSADREVVDRNDRIHVPPGEGSYLLRRVWLSEEEEQGYYYGLANEGLWPLCHIAHTRPVFRREDWDHYLGVNRRFAEAVCDEADTEDPIVFVQDYHFATAPRHVRRRLPRATILTFWHIPWPNAERFGICPWPRELLAGMLGSSILGFHTQLHCNNFLDCVDRHLEARIDREELAVIHRGRKTLVRAYPISVEWPSRWAQQAEPVEECREILRRQLGLPAHARLGLGVDRLDYTKGIEERMLSVEWLLERHPEHRGRFSFVQLAAPSRTALDTYQHLNDQVEAVARRINARFGRKGYQPIVLLREHHDPPAIYRAYRGADLCYVSSLHDGMNLVAKEFVAARDDEQGVLLLSRFTGAASEMKEALLVNPYDVEQAAEAMHLALVMDADEQRARMQAMRGYLAEFNVYRWAGQMIEDAARLREHERVAEQLEDFSDLQDAAQGARA